MSIPHDIRQRAKSGPRLEFEHFQMMGSTPEEESPAIPEWIQSGLNAPAYVPLFVAQPENRPRSLSQSSNVSKSSDPNSPRKWSISDILGVEKDDSKEDTIPETARIPSCHSQIRISNSSNASMPSLASIAMSLGQSGADPKSFNSRWSMSSADSANIWAFDPTQAIPLRDVSSSESPPAATPTSKNVRSTNGDERKVDVTAPAEPTIRPMSACADPPLMASLELPQGGVSTTTASKPFALNPNAQSYRARISDDNVKPEQETDVEEKTGCFVPHHYEPDVVVTQPNPIAAPNWPVGPIPAPQHPQGLDPTGVVPGIPSVGSAHSHHSVHSVHSTHSHHSHHSRVSHHSQRQSNYSVRSSNTSNHSGYSNHHPHPHHHHPSYHQQLPTPQQPFMRLSNSSVGSASSGRLRPSPQPHRHHHHRQYRPGTPGKVGTVATRPYVGATTSSVRSHGSVSSMASQPIALRLSNSSLSSHSSVGSHHHPPPPAQSQGPPANLADVIERKLVRNFAYEQIGSRYLQAALKRAEPRDLRGAFDQLYADIVPLSDNVFGNYVIQKFLEHGSPRQRCEIVYKLRGHFLRLCRSTYGCRVVQKILEFADVDTRLVVLNEIDGHFHELILDDNGNHVIQKVVREIPFAHLRPVYDCIQTNLYIYCQHMFGCRVIQRVLEHGEPDFLEKLTRAILDRVVDLCQDAWGNYVIQHILENGAVEVRVEILDHVVPRVTELSRHKFASNVVEKAFTVGSYERKEELLENVMRASDETLSQLVCDQFGNYVIQKALEVMSRENRQRFIARIGTFEKRLESDPNGLRVLNRIEQLASGNTDGAEEPAVVSEN